MTIPKHSDSGRTLRLKGKGIARAKETPGDQYVSLKIVLGEQASDPELERFLQEWAPAHPANPRRDMVS